jgi:hypothetical protein
MTLEYYRLSPVIIRSITTVDPAIEVIKKGGTGNSEIGNLLYRLESN